MTDYERCKLQQFVDIVQADGRPKEELLGEVAEIIGQMLMFSRYPIPTVASYDLIKLARSYGLTDIPRPAFSLPILQEIMAMEQKKAMQRIKQ